MQTRCFSKLFDWTFLLLLTPKYVRSVQNSSLYQKTKLQQIMFLTTIPKPLGNYQKNPVLKSVFLKKVNAIHIPNPETVFRKAQRSSSSLMQLPKCILKMKPYFVIKINDYNA